MELYAASGPTARQNKIPSLPTAVKPPDENNPRYHTQKLKFQMRALIAHLRNDVTKITDAKAQALFETSAEVLTGLVKAFNDFEKKNEKAWKA